MVKQKKTQRALEENPDSFLMAGYKLTSAAAVKLEQRVKNKPFDLPSRLKLLGYYFKTSNSSKSDERKQVQIIVWMIQEMPDHPILRTPWTHIDSILNTKAYEKCKKLWIQQIAADKNNVAIITNAARFLSADTRIAENLYKRAIRLEPTKAEWSRALARHLKNRARKNSPRMEKALVAMDDAIRKTPELIEKWYLFNDLAQIAFDVGKWSIAKNAAKKSVALAEKHRGSWYEWTAIHDGNCILGRLALKNGDIRRAALHLSDAGKACGSPWRGSLGPKMQFAQEMLRAGQREAVVSYLESCKAFWPCNTENLSTCITQIREGKSPRLAQDSFWVDLRIKSRSSMAVYGQAK